MQELPLRGARYCHHYGNSSLDRELITEPFSRENGRQFNGKTLKTVFLRAACDTYGFIRFGEDGGNIARNN